MSVGKQERHEQCQEVALKHSNPCSAGVRCAHWHFPSQVKDRYEDSSQLVCKLRRTQTNTRKADKHWLQALKREPSDVGLAPNCRWKGTPPPPPCIQSTLLPDPHLGALHKSGPKTQADVHKRKQTQTNSNKRKIEEFRHLIYTTIPLFGSSPNNDVLQS